MTRAIRQLLLLVATLVALTAETAVAGPYDIIRDCIDDERLQGDYSDAQLNRALRRLTGDVDEYSNCRAIIKAEIGDDPKAKSSTNRGDGSGKGANADLDGDGRVTAAERRKAKRLARERARERQRERDEIAAIGDTLVTDDDGDGDASGGGSGGIPLPAALALAALVLGGAGGGTWLAAQRNPTIANALRRAGLPLPPRD